MTLLGRWRPDGCQQPLDVWAAPFTEPVVTRRVDSGSAQRIGAVGAPAARLGPEVADTVFDLTAPLEGAFPSACEALCHAQSV